MYLRLLTAAAVFAAAPAFAEETPTGDAAAGEAAFRQCATCHHVIAPDGTVLAGRENVKTGPNLYGIAGGAVADQEGFRYGSGLQKYAEGGTVWTEDNFAAYTKDPTAYLREATGDASVRSNMTYKVRKEEDAHNIYAYLFSLTAE